MRWTGSEQLLRAMDPGVQMYSDWVDSGLTTGLSIGRADCNAGTIPVDKNTVQVKDDSSLKD